MLTTLLQVIALLCIAAVIYSYLLYPFVLAFVAACVQTLRDARYVFRKRERRARVEAELPAVAVVISAFNEERHIGRCICSLAGVQLRKLHRGQPIQNFDPKPQGGPPAYRGLFRQSVKRRKVNIITSTRKVKQDDLYNFLLDAVCGRW